MAVTKVYSNKESIVQDSLSNYGSDPAVNTIGYSNDNSSNLSFFERLKIDQLNSNDLLTSVRSFTINGYGSLTANTTKSYATTTAATNGLMIEDTRGIFAIPYQFMESVDKRIRDENGKQTKIGAKYAEKIVAKMPLLFITPCKQKFMSGYDKNERGTVLQSLINGEGLDSTFINSALSQNGRYYTTEFKWDLYFKYVNTLCGIMAAYMGIDNVQIDTNNGKKKIKNINWATDFLNGRFKSYFNAQNAVIYYLDGQSITEMSESFSNSTTESSLASQLNGYSEQVNEIKYLLGEDNALLETVGNAANELSEGLI